jgi:hypothetical protein
MVYSGISSKNYSQTAHHDAWISHPFSPQFSSSVSDLWKEATYGQASRTQLTVNTQR